MPAVCRASEDDWRAVKAAWETGQSLGGCSRLIDGRAAPATIRRRAIVEEWVRQDGTGQVIPPETRKAMTEAAHAASVRRWVDERDRIVSRLIAVTDDALDDMKRPTVAKEAKVVSGGKDMPSTVEIVEIEYAQAPISERKSLMWIAQTAVEKLQLLTGEATARTETGTIERDAVVTRTRQLRDELAERRAAQAIQAEQATG